MRIRVSSIGLLVVVGLLAGCGGGSSSSSTTSSSSQTASFKAGFEPAVTQLKQTAIAVAGAIKNAGSQSDAELQSTFSGLASQWQSGAGKLDALHPPSAAASDFNALKSSAASVETDLNAISSAAASGDAAAAKRATVKVITDILAAKSASLKVEGDLSSG